VVDTEVLANTELFGALPPDQLATLARSGRILRCQRGDVLFAETDEPSELYVVVSGRVAIFHTAADGRESMVALMEPGDLFGELPLFDGQPRSAGAKVLELSEVAALPYGPVRSLYESQPTLLWQVVNLLSQRLRVTGEALADSVFLDVTGRTAKRLLELADGADEFTLPVTQEELAGMVGASRERVNKAISSFVRLGWIAQADRHYRILDRTQMERRSR
jgi:CRP-like cAMP-binding protein